MMNNVKEMWFGNFYEPAYSDFKYIDSVLELLKSLGFTSVLLDSKAWEDFKKRFEIGDKSEYIKAQEYIMQKAKEIGLEYSFLALYLSGDNLYPDIRFSPPILGSAVVDKEGKEQRWYRYWSDKAKDVMEAHVKGLVKTYPESSIRICSMWDPIVAPSFDENGRKRYISFLKRKYKSINILNEHYGTVFDSFDSLKLSELWIDAPNEENLNILSDNREWQSEELSFYFDDMRKRLSGLFLSPVFAQWGFFLTFDGSRLPSVGLADLWDTANRGIDLYLLREMVDEVNFISVPVDPDGSADAYVTAFHHRYMASMNRGRDFSGGIFLGRFLYGDIYSVITPLEIIGTIVASGAKGYRAYGVNGLDDGGLFDLMDSPFLESVREANAFVDSVLEHLGKKKANDIAILFPMQMALSEPYSIKGNKERRLDSLGYLRMILDHGLDADVVDIRDVPSSDYKILIAPADSLYDGCFDDIVRDFVEKGGVLIISASNRMGRVFEIEMREHNSHVISLDSNAILQGVALVPLCEDAILKYKDGSAAAIRLHYGKGVVYQFGFDYGYEYVSSKVPHVPRSEKNSAIYPVSFLKRQIISEIIGGNLEYKGLEIASFENGCVMVNHTSYDRTIEIEGVRMEIKAHSSVCFERK